MVDYTYSVVGVADCHYGVLGVVVLAGYNLDYTWGNYLVCNQEDHRVVVCHTAVYKVGMDMDLACKRANKRDVKNNIHCKINISVLNKFQYFSKLFKLTSIINP